MYRAFSFNFFNRVRIFFHHFPVINLHEFFFSFCCVFSCHVCCFFLIVANKIIIVFLYIYDLFLSKVIQNKNSFWFFIFCFFLFVCDVFTLTFRLKLIFRFEDKVLQYLCFTAVVRPSGRLSFFSRSVWILF